MTATMHTQVRLLRTRAGSGCLNDSALRGWVDEIVAAVEDGREYAEVAQFQLGDLVRRTDARLREMRPPRAQKKSGRKAGNRVNFR